MGEFSSPAAVTPAVTGKARRRDVGPVLVGWLLLALCVGSFASGWTAGLHPATFDQLTRDRTAGAVERWYMASHVGSAGRYGFAEAEGSSPPDDDTTGNGILVWEAGGHWWVATHNGDATGANPAIDAAAEALRAGGVPAGRPYTDAHRWLTFVMVALWFLPLALARQNPLRGNRWFWFWIGLVPLGVGIAAFAIAERIRPRSVVPARRASGWQGVGGSLCSAPSVSRCRSADPAQRARRGQTTRPAGAGTRPSALQSNPAT